MNNHTHTLFCLDCKRIRNNVERNDRCELCNVLHSIKLKTKTLATAVTMRDNAGNWINVTLG